MSTDQTHNTDERPKRVTLTDKGRAYNAWVAEAGEDVFPLAAFGAGWDAAMQAEPLADVIAYLQGRRRDALVAIRNCHPDNYDDYWRWRGHAELSRQLLQRLGAEVPQ